MSQECWYSSHFCDNRGFAFRIHRCLSKETKKTRNEYKLSLIMIFISKFYLYKCSHFLCSQACTCSYMSQECWYSSHLRHTDEFYPCIRPGLKKKKRKQYKPPTSYIVYKPRHSTQEKNLFCSMLSASGKTDCFTHCEKSKHRSRGVPPIMASTGKLRPNCKRGTFSRLQVYERV